MLLFQPWIYPTKSCQQPQIVWLISVTSANETTTLIFPDLFFSFSTRGQTGTLIPRGSNLVYFPCKIPAASPQCHLKPFQWIQAGFVCLHGYLSIKGYYFFSRKYFKYLPRRFLFSAFPFFFKLGF